MATVEIEFTVEPFQAGDPGPHVLAAIDAARALGLDPDFGPFGTAVRCDADAGADVVRAVVHAAMAAAAQRVSVTITAVD